MLQFLVELPPTEYAQRQRLAKPWASATVANSSVLRNSSLNRLLNDSAKPFCHGDPGSRQVVVAPPSLLQRLRAWAMNSGPLSLRIADLRRGRIQAG